MHDMTTHNVACTRTYVTYIVTWRGCVSVTYTDWYDDGCVNFYSHFLAMRLRNRRANNTGSVDSSHWRFPFTRSVQTYRYKYYKFNVM